MRERLRRVAVGERDGEQREPRAPLEDRRPPTVRVGGPFLESAPAELGRPLEVPLAEGDPCRTGVYEAAVALEVVEGLELGEELACTVDVASPAPRDERVDEAAGFDQRVAAGAGGLQAAEQVVLGLRQHAPPQQAEPERELA